MSDIKVVAPMNMGKRLDWNDETKKYDVNVEDLLAEIKRLKENQNVDLTPSIDDPKEYFNLDTDLTGLGMKVFYGDIAVLNEPDKAAQSVKDAYAKGSGPRDGSGKIIKLPTYVKGMPKKPTIFSQSGEMVDAGYEMSDFEGNQWYDFIGYQFATPVEIVQVFYHMSQCYIRTNDAGMRLDGSFVNPNGWNKWRKL